MTVTRTGDPVFLDLLETSIYAPQYLPSWDLFDSGWDRLTLVEKDGDDYVTALLHLARVTYAQIGLLTHKGLHQLRDDARALHIAKNAGYAGADQPDPWANFRLAQVFGISPLDGVLVRMSDKYIRSMNLRRSPDNEQIGESLVDTLVDLAAYALIAVCLIFEARS